MPLISAHTSAGQPAQRMPLFSSMPPTSKVSSAKKSSFMVLRRPPLKILDSPLDSPSGFHPRLEVMLNEAHFGDQVGQVHQFRGCIPAREDHLHVGGTLAQDLQHLGQG